MTDELRLALARYAAASGLARWEMDELVHELGRIGPVSVVLEIGCHRGDSLRIWRALWPQALLLAVEPSDHLFSFGDLADVAATRASWVKAESQQPQTYATILAALAGRPIDFLYLDGDHHYEAVKRDFELYQPLVRPGGLTVLDDAVITWNDTVEVHRLYAEVRNGRRSKLLYAGLDPADPYGGANGAALIFS